VWAKVRLYIFNIGLNVSTLILAVLNHATKGVTALAYRGDAHQELPGLLFNNYETILFQH
jgi:hypothetical protein